MRILLKFTIFLVLIICSCDNKKDNNYYRIEIFNRNKNILVSNIEDSLIINSFEKELKSLKKRDYLKNPSDYRYFVNCYSKDTIDVYFINERYIGKRDGVYPSKVNFLKLLNIE